MSNSFDVVNYLFTPSPPLLVGDNNGCQFAPYNTYYEGLRQDLLATGLAAALRSSLMSGDTPASPSRGGGGEGGTSLPTAHPALQCASNKWKVPVGELNLHYLDIHVTFLCTKTFLFAEIELAKLEIPQSNMITSGSPSTTESNSGNVSPGADERALKSATDLAMQLPILLPAADFEILLVPVESEEAHLRRKMQRQSEEDAIHEEEVTEETNSNASSLTGDKDKGDQASNKSEGPIESDYCKNLADILTLSPFNMPYDYERRAVTKAERIRSLQQAMMELSEQQRVSLQEEISRGFQEWLVSSGNIRQILDLVHLEKKVTA